MSRVSRVLLLIGVAFSACTPAATSQRASPTVNGSASPASSVSPSAGPAATAAPTAPAAWHRIRPDRGPSAREDYTWTPDPNGSTAYLFGGRGSDGSVFRDLWAYDLAADRWRQIQGSGPAPRFGHNGVWVPGIGLVIFGGQSGPEFFNDLWAFDPESGQWRLLRAAGAVPVARYGSCAGLGPDRRLWISHGFTSEGARFSDTRAYDFRTRSWTDETPTGEVPIPRCLHACWWTDEGAFALYAGQTTGTPALDDLWHLVSGSRPGTNSWSRIRFSGGRMPPARQLYASARWNGRTAVFGGLGSDGTYLSDLWLIADDGRAISVPAGDGPPPRAGAELLADPDRHRLLLFGGKGASGVLDDVWELRVPG